MNTHTLSSEHLPKYLLLVLYIVTGTLSNFGAIDILAPQWIYLCSINILVSVYFIYRAKEHSTSFSALFSTYFIYFYLFYVLWNAGSYFYALNPVETVINLPRVINVFVAICYCFFLIYNLPNRIFFISRLFFFFLLAELMVYYNDFFLNFNAENFSVLDLKGFAGNKNITAASMAFKIPFLLYLVHSLKKTSFRIFVSFILFFAVLAISVIEARSAILSSLLVFLLFIGFQLVQILIKNHTIKKGVLSITVTLLPYLLALFVNTLISQKTQRSNLTATVGKIAFTEESSNGRFLYWSDALAYVKDHPIFASGLGNWKIASISIGKEHIKGYTVPYHAHNDFVHVFAETGILGGLTYLSIFAFLTFYLFKMLYDKYRSDGVLQLHYFILLLPLVVYGIDAGLNFPVARPLMQSSFAIFAGLILTLYLAEKNKSLEVVNPKPSVNKITYSLVLLVLLPSLYVHVLSFISLQKQGRLLYEFNNATFKLTRAELDEISHDFPNLTETAMPIKAMKARYYYLQGNKAEAFEMIDGGIKDNPQIFFGENLKAQYLLQEKQYDSAYVYAKRAFEGLPNNMPHYDIYMRTLVIRKDYEGINKTFERVKALAGDTKTVWTIYIRSLAQTRSLGDPFSMEKAAEAYRLFPKDETVFLLYRILTYGQPRIIEAEQKYKQATEFYNQKTFDQAAKLFAEAFDLDPLNHTYSLNTGLAYYEGKAYDKAIAYFDLAFSSKRSNNVERALRFKALALYRSGRAPEACALFLKLKNTYPKRMYRQEFQKYCLSNTNS
ncbi:MAG: O-antigen ligase family protein [Flavobacteriaceae bacterium]